MSNKNQFDELARLLLPLVAKGKIPERYLKPINTSEMEQVRDKRKQAGRPAKSIKKDIRTAVRFSKAEFFVVRQKAEKAGVKPSAFIRQVAIEGVVTNRLNNEERQFVRQLIGMSNNLNQLTKNSHQEGMLKTMMYFEGFRNQIDELLKKLNHGQ